MTFTHFIPPTMIPKFLKPAAIVLEKITAIISYTKWAWDLLLHRSFFQSDVQQSIDSHSVRRTACNSGVMDSKECAVCLCRIGGGDEIRELKCNHIFHRVCLDRWVGSGHWTCPLCRNHLKVVPRVDSEFHHQEVLVFNFCDFSSSNDDGTWWLR